MKRIGIILSTAAMCTLISLPVIYAKDNVNEPGKTVSTCCVSKCKADKEKCGECTKEKCSTNKKCASSDKNTGCKPMTAKSGNQGSCGEGKLSCPNKKTK